MYSSCNRYGTCHSCLKNKCESQCPSYFSEEKQRKSVVENNYKYVKSYPFLIDRDHIQTIHDYDHDRIPKALGKPTHNFPYIYVQNCSAVEAATYAHRQHPSSNICVLNSTDSIHPGGGYLKGLDGKEEKICRQTLLYPTISDNEMYEKNRRCGNVIDGSDDMIYSPNVYVIRDEYYKEIVHPFKVNFISATAISNKYVPFYNGLKIMERRIRKIIYLAAYKKNDVLILNDYGCGAYKNDATQIATIFHKVLVTEGLKNYFSTIIFSVNENKETFDVFQSVFKNK